MWRIRNDMGFIWLRRPLLHGAGQFFASFFSGAWFIGWFLFLFYGGQSGFYTLIDTMTHNAYGPEVFGNVYFDDNDRFLTRSHDELFLHGKSARGVHWHISHLALHIYWRGEDSEDNTLLQLNSGEEEWKRGRKKGLDLVITLIHT